MIKLFACFVLGWILCNASNSKYVEDESEYEGLGGYDYE